MSISFVGVNQAASTSVDISGLGMQRGDLLIAYAVTASGTRTELPSGWSPLQGRSLGVGFPSLFYRFVLDGAETASGFTNAVGLIVACYRHSTNWLIPGALGAPSNFTAAATWTYVLIPSYATITNQVAAARGTNAAWVIGVGYTTVTGAGIATAPSGMVNRSSVIGGTRELALHDTNANQLNWPSTNVTLSPATSGGTYTLEIIDSGIPKSAGPSRPVLPFQQQVIG